MGADEWNARTQIYEILHSVAPIRLPETRFRRQLTSATLEFHKGKTLRSLRSNSCGEARIFGKRISAAHLNRPAPGRPVKLRM